MRFKNLKRQNVVFVNKHGNNSTVNFNARICPSESLGIERNNMVLKYLIRFDRYQSYPFEFFISNIQSNSGPAIDSNLKETVI
jgi:hypothetical protein